MVNITQSLLPVNRFSRPGTKLIALRGIVVHWVGNAGSTAQGNRNWFESLGNQAPDKKRPTFASYHFLVGLQGEIIQCVPTNEMAFHAGGRRYTERALRELSNSPNNCVIGIGLCHPAEFDRAGKRIPMNRCREWVGKFDQATLDAARELIRDLCMRHRLTRRNMFRHFDVTGKDCPRWFVPDTHWEQFLDVVFS